MFLQKNIQGKPFHVQQGNIPLLCDNYSTECFPLGTPDKWNEVATVTQPAQYQSQV